MKSCFYIDDTRKYGKGIFAKRNIKKDEYILTFRGKVLKGMKYELDFSPKSRFWVQINKLSWLDISKHCSKFVNHSCNPNGGIFGRKLFALTNIRKDGEITYDYDTRDWDEWGWYLKCKCGSQNCRKLIKGYKYLPKSLKKKYQKLGLISDFLIRLDNGEILED